LTLSSTVAGKFFELFLDGHVDPVKRRF